MTHGTVSLHEAMDAHYGVGRWSQRTGVGVGSDVTPAINAVLAVRPAKLIATPGIWLMRSPINSALLSGTMVEGFGSQRTIFVYGVPWGAAFQFGVQSGGGIKGCGIQLEAGLGNSGAYAVLLQGNSASQPSQSVFEDLYITAIDSGSFWWSAFHLDGSAKQSEPRGVRVVRLCNIQCFNSHGVGMSIINGVVTALDTIGIWTGKQGSWGNDLLIQGNSTNVQGDALDVSGTVRISSVSRVRLSGFAGGLVKDESVRVYTDDLILP